MYKVIFLVLFLTGCASNTFTYKLAPKQEITPDLNVSIVVVSASMINAENDLGNSKIVLYPNTFVSAGGIADFSHWGYFNKARGIYLSDLRIGDAVKTVHAYQVEPGSYTISHFHFTKSQNRLGEGERIDTNRKIASFETQGGEILYIGEVQQKLEKLTEGSSEKYHMQIDIIDAYDEDMKVINERLSGHQSLSKRTITTIK